MTSPPSAPPPWRTLLPLPASLDPAFDAWLDSPIAEVTAPTFAASTLVAARLAQALARQDWPARGIARSAPDAPPDVRWLRVEAQAERQLSAARRDLAALPRERPAAPRPETCRPAAPSPTPPAASTSPSPTPAPAEPEDRPPAPAPAPPLVPSTATSRPADRPRRRPDPIAAARAQRAAPPATPHVPSRARRSSLSRAAIRAQRMARPAPLDKRAAVERLLGAPPEPWRVDREVLPVAAGAA
jgi:hypothetical protein